jgi:integrase
VQIVHATLHKALKQAVKWRLIPLNIAASLDPPRAPRAEINPLNAEQVKRLLAVAQNTDLYALYVLAITTGMRQGSCSGYSGRT